MTLEELINEATTVTSATQQQGNDVVSTPSNVFIGNVDASGIARMLPQVHDLASFVSAMQKIKNNQMNMLSGTERMQMCMAFISLLELSQSNRTTVIAKLAGLKYIPVPVTTSQTTSQTSQN